MNSPAIILGLSPGGLASVRSLGRAGVQVHSVDSRENHPAGSSRYGQFHRLPDPVSEPEELVTALQELGGRIGGRPVLMPSTDSYVLFLSRNREALLEDFVFRLPDPELLEKVVDKEGMADICLKVGIPHPPTHEVHSSADAEKLADVIEFPVLVKPKMGHLWRDVMGKTSKGVEVNSRDELLKVFEAVKGLDLEVIVQSIVRGPDSNLRSTLILMGEDGEIRALTQHRTIRQFPPFYGVGSCSESFVDKESEEIAIRLLRGIGWRGPASVQSKRDERGGPPVVLEINPLWGQTTALGITAGVNLPLLEYKDSTGADFSPVTEFKEGLRWIDLAADILSARFYVRRTELTWLTWLGSLSKVKAHAYWDIRDPMPFLKTYLRRFRETRGMSYAHISEPHKVEHL